MSKKSVFQLTIPVNDLYALYVEKMVGHAKQAARHFNAGKRKQADENIKLATETYNKAINLLPTRPEAYLNHATFLFNIQLVGFQKT